MQALRWRKQAVVWSLAGALLCGLSLHATPEEAENSEARARESFDKEFSKFMQDKNIQGRAKSLAGKTISGGVKNRFNEDDGLAFQSDLTYHDHAFTKVLEEQGNGKQPKTTRLQPFVSDHGAVSAAGGSSLLERVVFGLYKKFTAEEEKKPKQPETEGVRFEGVFKVTTKEIFEQPNAKKTPEAANGAAPTPPTPPAASQQASNSDEEDKFKPKIDRFELRDGARQEVEKVGDTASQTIINSAKGQQDLGNGVLLREGAYSLTTALWNSTLANLHQRRAFQAIRSSDTLKLSEGTATCEAWTSNALAELNQKLSNSKNPEIRQKLEKEIQRISGQCKELGTIAFDNVDPYYNREENDKEVLRAGGSKTEDAFQRDSRLQLLAMSKAGKSVKDFESNWQFSKNDEKAKMTISYDDNQPKEGSLSMKEQLDSYNANLEDAEEGYNEVKKRIPGLAAAKPTDYAIQPGTKNILEINRPPDVAFEEVGAANQSGPRSIPNSYRQLLKNAQTN